MGKCFAFAILFALIGIGAYVFWTGDDFGLTDRVESFLSGTDGETVQTAPAPTQISTVAAPTPEVAAGTPTRSAPTPMSSPTIIPTATPVPIPTPTRTPVPPTNTPVPTPLPRSSSQVAFVYVPSLPAGTNDHAVQLMREDMLTLINRARNRTGAGEVTLGNNLSPQAHAEFMRDSCTVTHTGSGGSDKRQRWERSGGSANVLLAENVNGYRTCTFNVPRSRSLGYYVNKLMDSLMDSSRHRAIIEDGKYDEVHIGFAINGNGAWVSQLFVDLR